MAAYTTYIDNVPAELGAHLARLGWYKDDDDAVRDRTYRRPMNNRGFDRLRGARAGRHSVRGSLRRSSLSDAVRPDAEERVVI